MTPQKIEEPQGSQDNGTSASTAPAHECIFSSGPMFEEPEEMIEERLASGDPQYEKALREWEAESKAKKAGEIDEEQEWLDFVNDLIAIFKKALKWEKRAFEVEEKALVREREAAGVLRKRAEAAKKGAEEEKKEALEDLKAAFKHLVSLRAKNNVLQDASSSGTAQGRCQLMDEEY